jgi:hypothetical protein
MARFGREISARDGEPSLNLRVGRRSASRPPSDALGIADGDGGLVPEARERVGARHPHREHAGVRGRTLAGVADEPILVDVTFSMLHTPYRRIAEVRANPHRVFGAVEMRRRLEDDAHDHVARAWQRTL